MRDSVGCSAKVETWLLGLVNIWCLEVIAGFSECSLWPLKIDYKWPIVTSPQVTDVWGKSDQGLWILSRWLIISKVFLGPYYLSLHLRGSCSAGRFGRVTSGRQVSTSCDCGSWQGAPTGWWRLWWGAFLSSSCSLPESFVLRCCLPCGFLTIVCMNKLLGMEEAFKIILIICSLLKEVTCARCQLIKTSHAGQLSFLIS